LGGSSRNERYLWIDRIGRIDRIDEILQVEQRRLPGSGEKRRPLAPADLNLDEVPAPDQGDDQGVTGAPQLDGVVPGQGRLDFMAESGRHRAQIQEIPQYGAHGCSPSPGSVRRGDGNSDPPTGVAVKSVCTSMTYSRVICNRGIMFASPEFEVPATTHGGDL
jgi:hypothetical protein